jgi:hypothetical protein
VRFVDYKSGKANDWAAKIPNDLKMRATAWLVWRSAGKPSEVHGFVEYIETTWDDEAKEIVPVADKETEVIPIVYTDAEMESFTTVIYKAMTDVNAYYKKWLESSGEFVKDSDVAEYIEYKTKYDSIEEKMSEVLERIQLQMEFGGEDNHKVDGRSFYLKRTEKWEYPEDLKVRFEEEDWMLRDTVLMANAVSSAKKNYELVNDPVEVKAKVQFRAKSVKKV